MNLENKQEKSENILHKSFNRAFRGGTAVLLRWCYK